MDTKQFSLIIIALIMLLMGLFGGIVNYYQNFDEKTANRRKYWTCICVSMAASLMVPLFLATISSNLLENCDKEAKNYFEFAGLCLIAAIFSRRFIDTLGKRILKEQAETKEEVQEAKQQIELQQSTINGIAKQVLNLLPTVQKIENQNNEGGMNDNPE